MQQLRSMLRFVSSTLESNPDLLKLNPELQNIIQYEIPYLLAQTLMDSEDQPIKSTVKKRTHALQTAVEYIKTTPKTLSYLNKFCQTNGINERTLQRAFLDHYGISPKSYLLAYHLNNAYKALKKNNSESTSISEVAGSFGFSHMSQFAKDYRRHFGELSSETLNGR